MAIWTTLPDAALEPGKPIRSIDGLALRDNPIAIANGASGAPRIQTAGIQDSAVTTAKLANDNVTTAKLANDNVTTAKLASNERMNTGNVLAATAAASTGAVGTYAFLGDTRNVSTTEGDTIAASNLRYSSRSGVLGGTPSGTWRAMGRSSAATFDPYGGIQATNGTVFLRIS